jgi:hypothetical protein
VPKPRQRVSLHGGAEVTGAVAPPNAAHDDLGRAAPMLLYALA